MKLAVVIISLFLTGYSVSKRMKTERIIGGYTVSVRNYPYMACLIVKSDLYVDPEMFAGGAVIISRHWAITAAHCVDEFKDSIVSSGHLFVRSNITTWNTTTNDKCDHLVVGCHVHELYDNITNDYDIALLKVSESFSGVNEKPIPLADKTYIYEADSVAVVLGWGTTKPDVDPFTVPDLRATEVNLISHDVCVELYSKVGEDLSPRMMCAGAPGKDACVDDSGGPLVQNRILIGLVSWGMECANVAHPGVYTNISEISEWLAELNNKIVRSYNRIRL